jgi:hypothetical protein
MLETISAVSTLVHLEKISSFLSFFFFTFAFAKNFCYSIIMLKFEMIAAVILAFFLLFFALNDLLPEILPASLFEQIH